MQSIYLYQENVDGFCKHSCLSSCKENIGVVKSRKHSSAFRKHSLQNDRNLFILECVLKRVLLDLFAILNVYP